MSEWYYASGGERFGPMPMDELKRAVADGRVKPTDRAWTDGWPDWQPATEIPGVAFPGADVSPADLNYAGKTGLPSHAIAAFKGVARPTGDTGVWPLNETQLQSLGTTGYHRRAVRRARTLYRMLTVLHLAFTLFVVLVLVNQGQTDKAVLGLITAGGVVLGFLYLLAAGATRRNYRWGGGLAIGLIAVDLAFCVIVMLASRGNAVDRTSIFAAYGVTIAVLLVVLFFAVRGIRAITRFRACPAWCQEAILRSEKRPARTA